MRKIEQRMVNAVNNKVNYRESSQKEMLNLRYYGKKTI